MYVHLKLKFGKTPLLDNVATNGLATKTILPFWALDCVNGYHFWLSQFHLSCSLLFAFSHFQQPCIECFSMTGWGHMCQNLQVILLIVFDGTYALTFHQRRSFIRAREGSWWSDPLKLVSFLEAHICVVQMQKMRQKAWQTLFTKLSLSSPWM